MLIKMTGVGLQNEENTRKEWANLTSSRNKTGTQEISPNPCYGAIKANVLKYCRTI